MKRRVRVVLAAGAAMGMMVTASGCSKESARTTPAQDSATAGASPSSGSPPADAPAPPRAPGSYVGVSYITPPDGVKSIDGAILSSPGDVRGNYAFTHVTTPNGDMIWLDTLGASHRTVLAELKLPPLARDERLFVGSCDVGGRLEPRAVAIVVNEPNVTRFTKIRQAWRVSLREARFDVLPVAGIVCEDPGS